MAGSEESPWYKQAYQRPPGAHLGAHASVHALTPGGELTPRTRLARHFVGQGEAAAATPDLIASSSVTPAGSTRGIVTRGGQVMAPSPPSSGPSSSSSSTSVVARPFAASKLVGGAGSGAAKAGTAGFGAHSASQFGAHTAAVHAQRHGPTANAYAAKTPRGSWISAPDKSPDAVAAAAATAAAADGTATAEVESEDDGDVAVAAGTARPADTSGSTGAAPRVGATGVVDPLLGAISAATTQPTSTRSSVTGASSSRSSPASALSSAKRRRLTEADSLSESTATPTPRSALRQRVFTNCSGMRMRSPRCPTFPFAVCSSKGRRRTNEDRFAVVTNVNDDPRLAYYAVFDGHGGTKAADFAAQHLCDSIVKRSEFQEHPIDALREGFETTDERFAEEFAHTSGLHASGWYEGTTALVALVMGRRILISNAGDSRAVMLRRGEVVHQLSNDHRPTSEDERARVVAAGGSVQDGRVDGILSLSRSIGDRKLRSYVIATPEVREHNISEEDEMLIMASDGLWDVLGADELYPMLTGVHVQTGAERLVAESVLRGSKDNITVLIVDLRPDAASFAPPRPPPTSSKRWSPSPSSSGRSPRSRIASQARKAMSTIKDDTILLPPPPARFKSKRTRAAEALKARAGGAHGSSEASGADGAAAASMGAGAGQDSSAHETLRETQPAAAAGAAGAAAAATVSPPRPPSAGVTPGSKRAREEDEEEGSPPRRTPSVKEV